MTSPRTRALIACTATLAAAGPALAQQASDACSGAPLIQVNQTYNSSTAAATTEIFQTCGIGDSPDVWYRFTAPSDGNYTVTVRGFGIDPTLAAFGVCGGPLIDCNDDINFPDDLDAQLFLSMTAGQTVRLRIAANFGDEGGFSIRVEPDSGGGGPMNDDCAGDAAPIVTVGVPAVGTNVGANTTTSLPFASCGDFLGSGGQADVFFRFIPPSTGAYAVETCGSSFDTVVSIHSACPVSGGNLLACNDDASPECPDDSTLSRINAVSLNAGQTYYIRVAGYSEGVPATGSINLLVSGSAPATGACCRGSSCAVTAEADCTGFASRWSGAATTCNTAGNLATPCCKADFNQVGGVTVQDIFDYLTAYFAVQLTADINADGVITLQDLFDFLTAYFADDC